QAQNLHTLLHGVSFDLVLCSELERAQHTARLVLSGRQLPVHIIPAIKEMFFGEWERRKKRERRKEEEEKYREGGKEWKKEIKKKGEGGKEF
ncbi:histidine phosphatase family protein, partial [Escherichia coli]|uniref:histidine phosphatase family protein n=1 Tax=Escherichia coli TaxID=562 RepID=UPI0035D437BF